MSISSTKTGRTIHGHEEYIYFGVRYIYRPGRGDKSICVYSSFAMKGNEQSYDYVKFFDDMEDFSVLWLLDSNSPITDPRGTYFMGDLDLSYLRSVKSLIMIELKMNINNIYHIGSSKGGTGALLSAAYLEKGKVIINAPQVDVGKYLEIYCPDAINHFGSDTVTINHKINALLKSNIKELDIIMTCGVDDYEHILGHVTPFMDQFASKAKRFRIIPIMGGHDGVALEWYQKVLSTELQLHDYRNEIIGALKCQPIINSTFLKSCKESYSEYLYS